MRKQTKLVAVMSAAALLAIGASMTSFAATKGWVMEGEDWVYLDSNGERVCNDWRRSNNNSYYLDENGIMAKDALIDDDGDFYYVDANGVRLVNAWKELPNDDSAEVGSEGSDDNIPETLWYYFGSTGKAYVGTKVVKVIDGQHYMFNDDGQMYSGWQETDEDLYYFGDEKEGWARKGWQYLEPKTDDDDEYDEFEWYYFGTNGKATKDKSLYINGAYYKFDENGVMSDGWDDASYTESISIGSTSTTSTASTADREDVTVNVKVYGGSGGSQKSGWVYTSDPDDSDDMYWYYLVAVKGTDNKTVRAVPFNYQEDGDATDPDGTGAARAATIKNKIYLFNANGKMLNGFVVINSKGNDVSALKDAPDCEEVVRMTSDKYDRSGVSVKNLDDGLYYFSESAGSTEGQMQTGRKAITKDGETFYYCFDKSGKAYANEVKDGYLYGADGKCVVGEAGSSYSLHILEADTTNGSKTYDADTQVVVSRNGKIKLTGTVKIDGETYEIDKDSAEAKLKTKD